jgi:hypothetical protein
VYGWVEAPVQPPTPPVPAQALVDRLPERTARPIQQVPKCPLSDFRSFEAGMQHGFTIL